MLRGLLRPLDLAYKKGRLETLCNSSGQIHPVRLNLESLNSANVAPLFVVHHPSCLAHQTYSSSHLGLDRVGAGSHE